MLLGAIADDFTGATDLASMLVRGGMRTVQLIGVPRPGENPPDADAVVVALKSRTAPVRQAVAESLAALAWLRDAGCQQFFFKYCSTFDSTDAGNIGPVADALIAALDCGFSLACPAFPANARSVYQGYLFVGGTLLNESGMEHHPLTPMTDANLVRVLSRQTDGTVGLVPYATVEQGVMAIRQAMTALKEQGRRYAIVDAVSDSHLLAIGEAAEHHALITGGSGVAMGLPANFRRAGKLPERSRCRACCQMSPAMPRCWRAPVRVRRSGSSASRASMCPCCNSIRLPRPMPRGWSRAARDWIDRQARRHPHRHRRLCAAGQGDGAAAASRTRCGGRTDRTDAGTHRRGSRRARRAAAGRCRRRDRRCGGVASRRAQPAHRRGDRSGRALDLCRRRRRTAAAVAEVGQLRRRDFFLKAFEVLPMSR